MMRCRVLVVIGAAYVRAAYLTAVGVKGEDFSW
jgi:hypothetical protein